MWTCKTVLECVEAKQKYVGLPFVSMAEQPGKPGLQPVGKGQVLQVFPEEKLALPAVSWEAMQGKILLWVLTSRCCGCSKIL